MKKLLTIIIATLMLVGGILGLSNNKVKAEDGSYTVKSNGTLSDVDKIEWICKYLPNINLLTNVLICRCGDKKAEYLKSKGLTIDNESYLLDDYTKNLTEWESAGGVGIKRLTKVADNSTGKWKGLTIKQLTELVEAVA